MYGFRLLSLCLNGIFRWAYHWQQYLATCANLMKSSRSFSMCARTLSVMTWLAPRLLSDIACTSSRILSASSRCAKTTASQGQQCGGTRLIENRMTKSKVQALDLFCIKYGKLMPTLTAKDNAHVFIMNMQASLGGPRLQRQDVRASHERGPVACH